MCPKFSKIINWCLEINASIIDHVPPDVIFVGCRHNLPTPNHYS